MATEDQAIAILNKLCQELDNRQDDIELYNDAYDGKYKLHFASKDFDQYFAGRYKGFSDNWTAIVADAPHERLGITGIRLRGSEKGDDKLWQRWLENDADAYSDMSFLDAIVAKRSFALVWGDDEGKATVSWEHPSQAIVGYDPETRKRVSAAKVWHDDAKVYATLYLASEVWKFERPYYSTAGEQKTASGLVIVGGQTGWTQRFPDTDDTWPLENPLGVVPMVEFQNRPRLLHAPSSDIAGTLTLQHAINLLWAQLFTASDYRSYPARVVIGAEVPTIDLLDQDGEPTGATKDVDLKEWSMKRIQWLENPGAKIEEWSASDLENWSKIIDVAVGHISAQSRTPATYFMGSGTTISNISGDTMKALETGLVQRTGEKTEHFGRAARDVFWLMGLVEGYGKDKLRAISTGKVLWKDVENRSDAQRADALAKKRNIGYPLAYLLEQDGLPPTEVERVLEMVRDEQLDPYLANLGGKDAANADAEPSAVGA